MNPQTNKSTQNITPRITPKTHKQQVNKEPKPKSLTATSKPKPNPTHQAKQQLATERIKTKFNSKAITYNTQPGIQHHANKHKQPSNQQKTNVINN